MCSWHEGTIKRFGGGNHPNSACNHDITWENITIKYFISLAMCYVVSQFSHSRVLSWIAMASRISWDVAVPDLLQQGTVLTRWDEVMCSQCRSRVWYYQIKKPRNQTHCGKPLGDTNCTFIIVIQCLLRAIHRFLSPSFCLSFSRSPVQANYYRSAWINMVSFWLGERKTR